MPKKVELSFPLDFDSQTVLPIPMGRLYLGPHVVRLALFPDGNLKLAVSEEAIQQGFILVSKAHQEELVGFGGTLNANPSQA